MNFLIKFNLDRETTISSWMQIHKKMRKFQDIEFPKKYTQLKFHITSTPPPTRTQKKRQIKGRQEIMQGRGHIGELQAWMSYYIWTCKAIITATMCATQNYQLAW